MNYDTITQLLGEMVADSEYAGFSGQDITDASEFLDFLDNFPGLAEAWDGRKGE